MNEHNNQNDEFDELKDMDADNNGKSNMAEIIDWVKHIGIALLVAFLISRFVIVNAHIPTPSMEETIMVNDRIIAFRMQYMFAEPQRGDIVVFKFPDDEKILYVKRVIGLPGEQVKIQDGKVFVNDKAIEENYLNEPMIGNFGPFIVPEGEYFMLGDNRNNSRDSRYWTNKFVEKNKILGKAIFSYFPKFKLF